MPFPNYGRRRLRLFAWNAVAMPYVVAIVLAAPVTGLPGIVIAIAVCYWISRCTALLRAIGRLLRNAPDAGFVLRARALSDGEDGTLVGGVAFAKSEALLEQGYCRALPLGIGIITALLGHGSIGSLIVAALMAGWIYLSQTPLLWLCAWFDRIDGDTVLMFMGPAPDGDENTECTEGAS